MLYAHVHVHVCCSYLICGIIFSNLNSVANRFDNFTEKITMHQLKTW